MNCVNTLDDIISAKKGDKNKLSELVENNSGLIWSIVKRFLGRGYESEDLYQIGAIGLIKSIKRFDESYDVKLSTFAVPYILGEIKRFIRDDGIIKVSRSIKELASKIRDIQEKSEESLTISKMAKLLKVSEEDINLALESMNLVESIDENVYEDGNKEKIELVSNNHEERKNNR